MAFLAGVDADALRKSPLYAKSAGMAGAFSEQLASVSSALIASDGKELLIAARGKFASKPAGAIALKPDLVLFGSGAMMRVGAAQFNTGHTGTPDLVAQADSIAGGAQIWAVARGNAPLPFSGNAANLAAILRKANFVTLTARTNAGLALELRASAPDVNAARDIEETLRADVTLGAAGEARRPDIAAALRSIQVTRVDREVRLALSVSNETAEKLFGLF